MYKEYYLFYIFEMSKSATFSRIFFPNKTLSRLNKRPSEKEKKHLNVIFCYQLMHLIQNPIYVTLAWVSRFKVFMSFLVSENLTLMSDLSKVAGAWNQG